MHNLLNVHDLAPDLVDVQSTTSSASGGNLLNALDVAMNLPTPPSTLEDSPAPALSPAPPPHTFPRPQPGLCLLRRSAGCAARARARCRRERSRASCIEGTCFYTVGASDMLRRDRQALRCQTCVFTIDAGRPHVVTQRRQAGAPPGRRLSLRGRRQGLRAGGSWSDAKG